MKAMEKIEEVTCIKFEKRSHSNHQERRFRSYTKTALDLTQ